jgi:hypothetical protein
VYTARIVISGIVTLPPMALFLQLLLLPLIQFSPILQCLNGALNLTETTHLDILSVLDEMEV